MLLLQNFTFFFLMYGSAQTERTLVLGFLVSPPLLKYLKPLAVDCQGLCVVSGYVALNNGRSWRKSVP